MAPTLQTLTPEWSTTISTSTTDTQNNNGSLSGTNIAAYSPPPNGHLNFDTSKLSRDDVLDIFRANPARFLNAGIPHFLDPDSYLVRTSPQEPISLSSMSEEDSKLFSGKVNSQHKRRPEAISTNTLELAGSGRMYSPRVSKAPRSADYQRCMLSFNSWLTPARRDIHNPDISSRLSRSREGPFPDMWQSSTTELETFSHDGFFPGDSPGVYGHDTEMKVRIDGVFATSRSSIDQSVDSSLANSFARQGLESLRQVSRLTSLGIQPEESERHAAVVPEPPAPHHSAENGPVRETIGFVKSNVPVPPESHQPSRFSSQPIHSFESPNPLSSFYNHRLSNPALFEHPVQSSSLSNAPPKGTIRVMRMPDSITWQYCDPSGLIQGPFTGFQMHEWYTAGFFKLELQVKMDEDESFEPLGSFISRIGNKKEPFLIPLPSKTDTLPIRSEKTSAWDSARGKPPFSAQFPTFGTTLTAEQQNALERRKQEESILAARQKEFLHQQQLAHLAATRGYPSYDHVQRPQYSPVIGTPSAPSQWTASQATVDSTLISTAQTESDKKEEVEGKQEEQDSTPAVESISSPEEEISKSKGSPVVEEIPPVKKKLAKWTSPKEKISPPSFSEIQMLEARKAQERKAAKEIAECEKGTKEGLPAGVGWASNGVWKGNLGGIKKTLQQIQQEEEEARLKNAAAKISANVPKRYADTAASRSTSTVATGGGGWTVVGKSRTATCLASKSGVVAPQSKPATVNPPPPAPVWSNPSSPSEEFIRWARESMKGLNSNVNAEQTLQLLLSFPLTKDSQEIIAETIYANSTTMDGRRFAQEFVARRKGNWSDIVKTSVKKDDSEWNGQFKIVEKKGRKKR